VNTDYERAGLTGAEVAHLTNLVAAVESADPTARAVAVERADVLSVVAALDRSVLAPATARRGAMSVNELLDQLDVSGNVIGLVDPDSKAARAFVLKATPPIVRLIEDLTMRADVPPAHDGGAR
jgi:hypothetical protein